MLFPLISEEDTLMQKCQPMGLKSVFFSMYLEFNTVYLLLRLFTVNNYMRILFQVLLECLNLKLLYKKPVFPPLLFKFSPSEYITADFDRDWLPSLKN